MDVGHSGGNVPPELELLRAFADFHRPNLACPVVDVLEQMAMDGLQMNEVEFAGRNSFRDPLRCQHSFGLVQNDRIDDAKPISEDAGTGQKVWISGAAHLAASALIRSRMYARRRSCDQPSRSNISNI